MEHIRLIHWDKAEAEARAEQLHGEGFEVNAETFDGPPALRSLRENPPVAVVIDLSRSPSMGRDVGVALRFYKNTRHIPLVFVEGDPEKVAWIKELLPDAVYTTWGRIRGSLKTAMTNPPPEPVAMRSLLEGYSGTPLPKKLGIKANTVITLINAPQGFEETLGQLPEGVTIRKQGQDPSDLVVWFIGSRRDLENRIETITTLMADKGGMWIAWPKKASGVVSDLSQKDVREIGFSKGLVDYKVCSMDATWSGLLFSRRKSRQG